MVGQATGENAIIADKPFIASVAEILREKTFSGYSVKEFADILIDYWNGVRAIYPEAFEEAEAYTLLSSPGLPALNMLFSSIYGRCVKKNVGEAEMRGQLEGLLAPTRNHSSPTSGGP